MTTPIENTLLFYPGHQGPQGQLRFRGGSRAMAFEKNQVRAVPAPQSQDALRLSGFLEALSFAEAAKRFSVPLSVIEALGTARHVKTARFYPKDAEEPVPVVVLDVSTQRTLRVLQSVQGSVQLSAKKGKAK